MRTIIALCLALAMFMGCSAPKTVLNLGPHRIGDPKTMLFHTSACPLVGSIKHAITFPTRADAIASGFKPDDTGQCDP